MGIIESIKIAIKGLRLNILRTILTMLGIIIGIGSVITIFTIGDALQASVTDTVSQFGTETASFYIGPNFDEGYTYDDMYVGTSDPNLRVEMLDKARDHFGERITAFSYEMTEDGTIENGKDDLRLILNAVSPGYSVVNNMELAAGRFITEEDMLARKKVIVLGHKYVEEVYGGIPNAPLGKEVIIENHNGLETYTVVGILKKQDEKDGGLLNMEGMMGSSQSIHSYIPFTTYQMLSGFFDDIIWSFQMLPAKGQDPSAMAEEVSEYLMDTYFADNPAVMIEAQTLEETLGELDAMFNNLRLGLGGIAALSLLVGGIGVMNIMLVSVTERTREIGIRKSLGASIRDIRLQFLIESIIVTLFGGLIGTLIGGTGGYFVSKFLVGDGLIPGPAAIAVAVGFSMFVGVFFGFYPANKAAKLDPIDALRYE